MKRTKLVIMTMAIFFSIGSAFVTKAGQDCTFNQQYYLSGGLYVMTGVYGHDYICGTGVGACTYVLSGGVYVQCRIGTYLAVKLVDDQGQQKK